VLSFFFFFFWQAWVHSVGSALFLNATHNGGRAGKEKEGTGEERQARVLVGLHTQSTNRLPSCLLSGRHILSERQKRKSREESQPVSQKARKKENFS